MTQRIVQKTISLVLLFSFLIFAQHSSAACPPSLGPDYTEDVFLRCEGASCVEGFWVHARLNYACRVREEVMAIPPELIPELQTILSTTQGESLGGIYLLRMRHPCHWKEGVPVETAGAKLRPWCVETAVSERNTVEDSREFFFDLRGKYERRAQSGRLSDILAIYIKPFCGTAFFVFISFWLFADLKRSAKSVTDFTDGTWRTSVRIHVFCALFAGFYGIALYLSQIFPGSPMIESIAALHFMLFGFFGSLYIGAIVPLTAFHLSMALVFCYVYRASKEKLLENLRLIGVVFQVLLLLGALGSTRFQDLGQTPGWVISRWTIGIFYAFSVIAELSFFGPQAFAKFLEISPTSSTRALRS